MPVERFPGARVAGIRAPSPDVVRMLQPERRGIRAGRVGDQQLRICPPPGRKHVHQGVDLRDHTRRADQVPVIGLLTVRPETIDLDVVHSHRGPFREALDRVLPVARSREPLACPLNFQPSRSPGVLSAHLRQHSHPQFLETECHHKPLAASTCGLRFEAHDTEIARLHRAPRNKFEREIVAFDGQGLAGAEVSDEGRVRPVAGQREFYGQVGIGYDRPGGLDMHLHLGGEAPVRRTGNENREESGGGAMASHAGAFLCAGSVSPGRMRRVRCARRNSPRRRAQNTEERRDGIPAESKKVYPDQYSKRPP